MSLAPAERRALDKIEDGLRLTDRRLARMLTRFRVPLARGGLAVMVRKPRRRKPVIVAAIGVMALGLLVAGLWSSPAVPLTCVPSGAGPAATASRASVCPLALHRGHAASTVVNGTAK